MFSLPWSLQWNDIIDWIRVLVSGLIGGLVIYWLMRRTERSKEIEKKRLEVRERQPKLVVAYVNFIPYAGTCDYSVIMGLGNRGNTPARNIEITIDGRKEKVILEKIDAHPSGQLFPVEKEIRLFLNEDILQRSFEDPKICIKFHDQWFPEQEYPIVSINFRQRNSGAEKFKFRLDFEGWEQKPAWEQTAYSGYSDKQIIKIWEREKLGKGNL